MKTMWTKAMGLSVLCLLGVVTVMLALNLCSSKTGVLNEVAKAGRTQHQSGVTAVETGFSCSENASEANQPAEHERESKNSIPADMGITRMLTPIISEYLSSLLPRLLP